jgi:hypothetical protein
VPNDGTVISSLHRWRRAVEFNQSLASAKGPVVVEGTSIGKLGSVLVTDGGGRHAAASANGMCSRGLRVECKDSGMDIEEWWPKLSESAREWLIANNGDVVAGAVLNEIASAGGVVESGAWWIGEGGPEGLYLSDRATDWIEETANREH